MRHPSVIGLLLVVAVICPPVLAEDTPSPAVKRILDKAVGKVRTNRAEFDKANKKPLDEARAELQELSTKLIKDGETEEAQAVLKQIGTLEADVSKKANAPEPIPGGAAVPQKPLLERLAGKWKRSGFEYSITVDGMIQCSDGDGGQLVVVSPDAVEVVWRKARSKVQLRLAGEDVACGLFWDGKGDLARSYVLVRIK